MSIMNWVRARRSPLAKGIYSGLKRLTRARFPVVPGIHHILLAERRFRLGPLRYLIAKIYYEPLFRMQVRECGTGFVLHEDIPKLLGSLDIRLGDRVSLSGEQVWIGAGDAIPKCISIGSDTYIGHASQLISGSHITIGCHVLLANRVVVNGYDGHPLDPLARARNEPPDAAGRAPIVIHDYAWIGNDVTILPGVTIGSGAVVATGSIVTTDIPSMTVAAGVPAKVIRKIDVPDGWLPNCPTDGGHAK